MSPMSPCDIQDDIQRPRPDLLSDQFPTPDTFSTQDPPGSASGRDRSHSHGHDHDHDHTDNSASRSQSSGAASDPGFATRMNGLINEALGREPDGQSVIEPDSVLGESGRLYHGYKDGKYYIPNDAVRIPAPSASPHVYLPRHTAAARRLPARPA